ncbi:MAG: cbb3-type cytochrome c oxidase subunit I [Firmicutes bacterium]|jgi:cytochrome c oxidase subunit 1|nr:cbb3-type cytochrome c oxidase subunit I [Bacillota bacterium]
MRKVTIVWMATVLILFLVFAALGLLMKMNQAEFVNLPPEYFYAFLTLHGLGMIGIIFCGTFAGVGYLLSRYVKLNLSLMWFVYFFTAAGLIGLLLATLVGKFGAGWYVLYPLPFYSQHTWANWSVLLAIVSIIVLGVAWLIGLLHLIYAMSCQYGFKNLLGWQYLSKEEKIVEIPPSVLIVTVSSITGSLGIEAGAVMMMMYLFKFFVPSLSFNVLILKNLDFFFGHILANITLYLALAWVYELFPKYSGRPLKINKIIAFAWNCTLAFILFAYFHHLYMDFVQPVGLQFVGQIASYMSAVPATAVTLFSAVGQIYRSGIRWSFTPFSFYLGLIGWTMGGFAAVVDSTIRVNLIFHNTLWVPAHFHTYLLFGVFPLFLGFVYDFLNGQNDVPRDWISIIGLWIMVIGGLGFLLAFYLGGIDSVPRRFAVYSYSGINQVYQHGTHLAAFAIPFILILLFGIGMIYFSFLRKLKQAWVEP